MGARGPKLAPCDVERDGVVWHGVMLTQVIDGTWHVYGTARAYPEATPVEGWPNIVELASLPVGRLRATHGRRRFVLNLDDGSEYVVQKHQKCLPCSGSPLARFNPPGR